MKFFKTIWKKLKGLVTKRPPSTEQIISEEKSVLAEGIRVEDIYLKIQESINDKEKETLITQIARQKVAKGILEFVENESKPTGEKKRDRKNLYELHELRAELQNLEEQKAILNVAESKIHPINYPDSSAFDSRISKLFSLLSKNKMDNKIELSDFSISAFDKDFKQLEKLLSDKSTLKRHSNRERERKKQREIYESNIKKELNNLDSFISLNKLDDAKLLINRLAKSLKPDYRKGIERLSKATARLKEKELDIFKKRQEELLKRQIEEAQKIKQHEELKKNEEELKRKNLFESNTNYAELIKSDSQNFNCNSILRFRQNYHLYDDLERGVALLNGDKELRQYIHSFGNMHVAKLKDAFQLLINTTNLNHTNEKIEIFDWGCGQALGSIALIDQLKIYKNKNEFIESVTLIEPGIDALQRAALHVSLALKSQNKIKPINKYINKNITKADLANSLDSIKFHICSNIIDVFAIDADFFSELILTNMKGLNYIICVGPRFGDSKDQKMEYFAGSFKHCMDYKVISKIENVQGWKDHKNWTRKQIIIKAII